MVFGESGGGLFTAPSVIEQEGIRQYRIQPVGRVENFRERFIAISVEGKMRYPAIVAVTVSLREFLCSD